VLLSAVLPLQSAMSSGSEIRTKAFLLGVLIACVAMAVILALNIGGWRAKILSRLKRVDNGPVVARPRANFRPQVPPGFIVSVFAKDFVNPRWLAVAPNGDIFVADSAKGQVVVLHGLTPEGSAESRAVFADHLNLPFGIVFHGDYVYVANSDQVARFRYDPISSKRLGNAQHILDLPGGGYHQHWTRSLAISPNGQNLFVSVGSRTNESIESDPRRAAILKCDPDGKDVQVYADGLRNAVGIALNPDSGTLWAAVNERDDIGDDVPRDFFTHVQENGFYGWPYAYGDHRPDDRVSPRPDLVAKIAEPDVLLGAHVAPLQFAFYEKHQFPPEFHHGALIAEHGSWNRRLRSGYQVECVPFHTGMPAGGPRPFLWGFVPDPKLKEVYGRPVGVAVAADGSLLVSDDGARLIWRIRYEGSARR
jgi:glucose/arabinose dehydrogenase